MDDDADGDFVGGRPVEVETEPLGPTALTESIPLRARIPVQRRPESPRTGVAGSHSETVRHTGLRTSNVCVLGLPAAGAAGPSAGPASTSCRTQFAEDPRKSSTCRRSRNDRGRGRSTPSSPASSSRRGPPGRRGPSCRSPLGRGTGPDNSSPTDSRGSRTRRPTARRTRPRGSRGQEPAGDPIGDPRVRLNSVPGTRPPYASRPIGGSRGVKAAAAAVRAPELPRISGAAAEETETDLVEDTPFKECLIQSGSGAPVLQVGRENDGWKRVRACRAEHSSRLPAARGPGQSGPRPACRKDTRSHCRAPRISADLHRQSPSDEPEATIAPAGARCEAAGRRTTSESRPTTGSRVLRRRPPRTPRPQIRVLDSNSTDDDCETATSNRTGGGNDHRR